jgi:hypothetical protein
MTDANNRGEQRADEARRTDDQDLIESMEDAPALAASAATISARRRHP